VNEDVADEAIQKGKKLQDIWEYKDLMYPEYPTQKNQELLDLIIKNSSDKDCWVMDCFAGSGTTLVSATNYGRKWIGIDQSEQAISVIKNRLKKIQPNLFMKMRDYQFIDTTNPSLKQTNNLSEYCYQ